MNRYSFKNDYSVGASSAVINTLMRAAAGQEASYGNDSWSRRAAELIKQYCNAPAADVHFISGGTHANIVCLAAMLKPYEAIIGAETGHIAVHEAGAIEATGHKIYTVPTRNGKLSPDDITKVKALHTDEHMVMPRVVFISQSTERGTLYSKEELTALAQSCKEHNLLLYLDGARLGSAVTSVHSTASLADIASLCDMFYIGGTKNGAFFGEAIVITNEELKKNFRYHLKQRGALLAKGAALGAQFVALFEDDLFFILGKQANQYAEIIAAACKDANYGFLEEPVSNQLFPLLPNQKIEQLLKHFDFYVWQKVSTTHAAVRLITSWSTDEQQLKLLCDMLKKK